MKESINICGIEHSIAECDDNFNVDSHFAMIDYMKAEIRVNKDMSEQMKQEALCHEIMHAILVHLGYNELSQDEQLVQALANAINQTFTIK